MDIPVLISNATSTIANALGFNVASTVSYMSDSLLSLVIGGGLGVLQVLWPFILGLVVVSAIVYFIWRAFVFFRH